MAKQILRSGTSIGANVAESIYAQSRPDFTSKLKIALKEARETAYWLDLLHATNYIDDQSFESMNNDCGKISAKRVTNKLLPSGRLGGGHFI